MSEVTEIKRDYKHSCYVVHQDQKNDAVIVKYHEVHPDGTRIPKMGIHENFKRPFWVTKPGHRTHKDKTEWEEMDKLRMQSCTQLELPYRIQKALGMIPRKGQQLRHLFRSPYIYGCDIDITGLVKRAYDKRNGEDFRGGEYNVAVLDTETNMLGGKEHIIACTITYKTKIVCAYMEDWLKYDIEEVKTKVEEMIGSDLAARNCEILYIPCKTPGECVVKSIAEVHKWKPDFLAIWNITFDVEKMLDALKDDGIDPADVFSDPDIPREYRYFKWGKGSTQKKDRNGVATALDPSEQWHTVYAPASFYFIDAMSAYRIIRRVSGMLPSYSLEFVTNKELGEGKLKFQAEDMKFIREGSLDWHRYMQRHYRREYIAYNIIDCIRVEQLDEKTGDLRAKVGVMIGYSHLSNFNSNPRRICDQLHFFLLERGYVSATTSDKMETELDQYVVGMSGWIVTLSASQIEDIGLRLINDMPYRRSMMSIHAADLDIISTYPMVGMLLNISKETTKYELSRIQGMEYEEQRCFGINITGGIANSILLAQSGFGLKGMPEVLAEFRRQRAVKTVENEKIVA